MALESPFQLLQITLIRFSPSGVASTKTPMSFSGMAFSPTGNF
jgi:hypothetical protein